MICQSEMVDLGLACCLTCHRTLARTLLAAPSRIARTPDWCGWCARALTPDAAAVECRYARPLTRREEPAEAAVRYRKGLVTQEVEA